MNKKHKIIIVVVLMLALITTGYFCYKKVQEDKIGLISFENIKKEIINGEINIENEKVGLSFSFPDDWQIVNDDIGLSINSPNFISINDRVFIPQKGCRISVSVEGQKDDNTEYSDLKYMIEDENYVNSKNADKIKYEIIELSGLKGVKNQFFMANVFNNQGDVIAIYVPYDNKIYYFEVDLFGEDRDVCLQEFNNFLSTVFIKKK